jgi:hypothetical protein
MLFDNLTPLFLPSAEELAEEDFSKVVMATLLWLFLLNWLASLQALSNPDPFDPKVRFDYSNKVWALADRTFLNLTEQTPTFLTVMWLHAIFCNADMAGRLGLACVMARATYPILRTIRFLLMEFSTVTYYVCVNSMKVNLWYKLLYGQTLGGSPKLYALGFGYYLMAVPFGFGLKALLDTLRPADEEETKKDV